MSPNLQFSVCVIVILSALTRENNNQDLWSQAGQIQGATDRRRKRKFYYQDSDNQFGQTAATWLLQYDMSAGEGTSTLNVRTNIARDGLTIEVIHYWALIMAPPQSL